MKKSKLAIIILSLAFLLGGLNTNASSTYVELNFDKTVKKADAPAGDNRTSSLLFGTNKTEINSSSLSAKDNIGRSWSIKAKGISIADSFVNGEGYSQINFSDEDSVEKSLVLECDLNTYANVDDFSLKLGGIEGSSGDVDVTLDGQSLVSGNLNGTNDVTLTFNNQESKIGAKLVISITNITKAIKIYSIGYHYFSFDNNDAAYAISQLNTKAQLKYSFNVKEDQTIDFVTMKLNFGAIIKKSLVDSLASSVKKAIVKYGVAVAQKSKLGDTTISDAVIKNSSYVKVVSADYNGGIDLQKTNENGTAIDGDYVIFNANLIYINPVQYNTVITAVAFFALKDGSYVFLQERSCSVASLAQEYIESDGFSGYNELIKKSLNTLAEVNGQK
ncbi:MAG: hypothetical protein PUA88_05960 [Bacillales bacterium]|nr:hypothetical protein [Bacillales bacterium]